MKSMPSTWLITGISSGIGRALAEAALARGDVVIGTVRKQAQATTFNALAPGRAFAYVLDLTDRKAVGPVISRAITATGGVDILFNGAGYGLTGAVEETSDSEMRHQLETNFFGTAEITQAALPFMRKARSGHIFNVSSVAGTMGFAGMSFYCASKFAIEGFSEALRLEVEHLNIKVTIVELDGFRTKFANSSAIMAKSIIEDYACSAGKTRTGMVGLDGNQPGDPTKAPAAIFTVVASANPPLRLVLGDLAVDWIRGKLNSRLAELEAWEHVSRSTGFSA